MQTLLRLTALAVLSLSSLSLYAASGDAVSVLQECGAPRSDTFVHDAASAFPEQRLLTYGKVSLYFNQEKDGWSFLEAKRGDAVLDRAHVDQLLPCFHDAMQNVALYTPVQVAVTQPSAAPATLSERVSSKIRPMNPSPILLGVLALLYFLPAIVSMIRKPVQRTLSIVIDVLFAWTILGWVVALVLAFGERADAEREQYEEAEEEHISFTAPASAFLDSASSDTSSSDRLSSARPTSGPAWSEDVPEWNETPEPVRLTPVRPAVLAPVAEGLEPIPFVNYRKPIIDPLPTVPVVAAVELVQTKAAVTLPSDPGERRGIGFASVAPKEPEADPEIEWLENYAPGRRCRIEVVTHSRQVTLYEITLTCRGVDAEGREYLGGLIGKTFRVFPRDKVLHMRERVA